MYVLAGSLHDHSTDSDGNASAARIAGWESAHHTELGIDFGSLTDHSDYFPIAYQALQDGNVWMHQQRISTRYSTGAFAFLRGFEYTSDQENHLSVIGTAAFLKGIPRNETSMAPFYEWLAEQPDGPRDGIAQFNHPSAKGALQWDNLSFDAHAARNMATIEIYGDRGFSTHNLAHSDAGWYWLALARGWTLAPVMNWDTHDWHEKLRQTEPGSECGAEELPYLPCQRTLVIADADTPEAIVAALRARRAGATEHPSLWATLRGPRGEWQGSTVGGMRPGSVLELTVDAGSSIWPLTSVEIVSDNGVDPHPFYDGDNYTCDAERLTACRDTAERGGQNASSFELQHRRFLETNGYAVRKRQIDTPPPHTTIAVVELGGTRVTQHLRITIPRERSLRPDGRHFFYAIVHAGTIRAWTAPIFTLDQLRFADARGSGMEQTPEPVVAAATPRP